MKVLMAVRHPVGGIQTFLRDVYMQEPFDDVRISLVVPLEPRGRVLRELLPDDRFEIKPVTEKMGALCRVLRSEIRDGEYDLLHTHGLTSGLNGQVARLNLPMPHLLTIHDVFLPEVFAGAWGRMRLLCLSLLIRNISAVHAVGSDCAENFSAHIGAIEKNRVHAIRNGIDTARVRGAESKDVRKECGVPEGTRLVGFFGRFMAQKGFRTLVDAIEIVMKLQPDFPIKVVTFGWGGYIREDYDYVASKGMKGVFVQQPFTTVPEQWMKGLDVVAMPSRWEACPLQPMEALCAGVPFVGTNCIGLREVLENTPALVVPPSDPKALAASLLKALDGSVKHAAESFAEEAVTRFGVSETANALRKLYSSLSLKPPGV